MREGELNRRKTTLVHARTAGLSVKPASGVLRLTPVSSGACTPGVHQLVMSSCASFDSWEDTVSATLSEVCMAAGAAKLEREALRSPRARSR